MSVWATYSFVLSLLWADVEKQFSIFAISKFHARIIDVSLCNKYNYTRADFYISTSPLFYSLTRANEAVPDAAGEARAVEASTRVGTKRACAAATIVSQALVDVWQQQTYSFHYHQLSDFIVAIMPSSIGTCFSFPLPALGRHLKFHAFPYVMWSIMKKEITVKYGFREAKKFKFYHSSSGRPESLECVSRPNT